MSGLLQSESKKSETAAVDDSQVPHVGGNLISDLVKLRKSLKISQQQVAQALGVTQGSISQMESLKTDMSVQSAVRYAQVVGAELTVCHSGNSRSRKR